MIQSYTAVVSTRLHGAIAGLACQVPSILLAPEHAFRLRSARNLFGDLLPCLDVEEALDRAAHWAGTEDWLRRSRAIQQFKIATLQRYCRLLQPFLQEHVAVGEAASEPEHARVALEAADF
jgi:hypothetical protein